MTANSTRLIMITQEIEVPQGTEKLVCEDIARRQLLGIKKYGKTVEGNPLSHKQWLRHGLEEALDLAIYLKRAIQEIESNDQAKTSDRK